jgi:hypothetical protein
LHCSLPLQSELVKKWHFELKLFPFRNAEKNLEKANERNVCLKSSIHSAAAAAECQASPASRPSRQTVRRAPFTTDGRRFSPKELEKVAFSPFFLQIPKLGPNPNSSDEKGSIF